MQTNRSNKKNPSTSRPHVHGEKYPEFISVEATDKANFAKFGHLRVAVYARYSTDGQKATSIDDQIRMCRETAARMGMTVDDALIFFDEAISGKKQATGKREKYHLMREAVRKGQVDVLLCDQQCRLARHATEALGFFDDIKLHHVQLLCADGFDSETSMSQLLFGMKAVFAEFFLEETCHRVRRGMQGEFLRGAMVTSIPYGYQVDVLLSAELKQCRWTTDIDKAAVVKEIFHCRKSGMSFNQIAAVLNGRQVPTPKQKAGEPLLHWRGSGIWPLLQCAVYKGVYQVDFKSEDRDVHLPEPRLMPELILVSAADWDACNALGKGNVSSTGALSGQSKTRRMRGGGKHPFSGLFRCGVCDGFLIHHSGKMDAGSFHCVACEHANAAGVNGRQAHYVSTKGLKVMLQSLLGMVMAGEGITRYRECLRERLEGGRESELIAARSAMTKAVGVRHRLQRLLLEIGGDDRSLENDFKIAREDALHLANNVRKLEQGLQELNQDMIRKQLDINLPLVIDAFLSETESPERTRALLSRIFPRIILVGKTDRYTAIFEVHVKPGAILAPRWPLQTPPLMATQTPPGRTVEIVM